MYSYKSVSIHTYVDMTLTERATAAASDARWPSLAGSDSLRRLYIYT